MFEYHTSHQDQNNGKIKLSIILNMSRMFYKVVIHSVIQVKNSLQETEDLCQYTVHKDFTF